MRYSLKTITYTRTNKIARFLLNLWHRALFSLFVVSIVFNNESTEGGRRLQIQKCKPVNVKSSMTERTCCEHMALLRQVAYTQPAYRGTVMTHACTRLYRPTISECAWVRNAACCRPLSSGTSCARLETSGTIPSGYNGPLVPRIVRRLHYTRRRPSKLHASAPSTRTRDCILDMLKGIYIYIFVYACVYVYTYMEREMYPRKCEWIRWCCSAISLCGRDSATSSGYYYTEVGHSVVVASRCYYTSVILAISGALM